MFPFDAKRTKMAPFHLAGGKTVDVPMMHANQRGRLANLDGFAIAELPYAKGEQGMIVLLPNKADGLAELQKKVTAANLSAWMKKMSTHEIDLKLPKFKVTAQFKLNDVLQQMGMKDAFCQRPGRLQRHGNGGKAVHHGGTAQGVCGRERKRHGSRGRHGHRRRHALLAAARSVSTRIARSCS